MKKTLSRLIIATIFIFVNQFTIRANPLVDTYVTEDDQHIFMGNQYLELILQKSDGELYSIRHKETDTEFIDVKDAWWSLFNFLYHKDAQEQYVGGWIANSISYSTRTLPDGVALDLRWDSFTVDSTALDMTVDVTIEVKDDSPLTYWTIAITNNESITIEAVNFPALSGLGKISIDPDQDYLAFPSFSGVLFQNPLYNFIQNRGWGWKLYYPSAHCMMQFMAYYGLNPNAGLYIASYDSLGNSKFFNFSKPNPSWLHTTICHIPEFVAGGNYQMEYSVVVGVFSGDWYDAAQLYRTWALEQPWVSQGALWARSDIPDWYHSVGLRHWIYTHPLCMPDVNSFSVVPEIIEDTATYLGLPEIANWIGWEQEGWYIKYPDVFPPKEGWDAFRQAITDTHKSGNRILFVPNTTSYSELAPTWSDAQPSACRDKFGNYFDPFTYSECELTTALYKMCPATSFWQNKLDAMLLTLSQEGADEIQLDGFPIFGPQPCEDTGHGHPIGGGKWWYNNYHQIFSNFKTTARQTNPDLILSSEGMGEVYLGLLDAFWDPFTTGWSPNSLSSMLNDILKVRLIPLWHTVYHEYSFLESGNSFFSRNAPSGAVGYGDYRDFYVRGFGLALIWGEMPTTWHADEKISELNEVEEQEMANYLHRIIEARTGFAKSFLMYGRMLRMPNLDVPDFNIKGAKNIPYTLDDYPPFDSPSILCSVWKGPSNDAGCIFTNISHDKVTFEMTLTSLEFMLPQDNLYSIIQYRNGNGSILKSYIHLPQTFTFQIEPLDVLFIEVTSGFILTITSSPRGTTSPSPNIYTYSSGTQVNITAIPDNGYRFMNWSGAASGTDNPITVTMDADKSIKANFSAIPPPEEEAGKKGGCFIATAGYGSPLHPYVKTLRDFRDTYFMPNKFGRKLVGLYYKYSPVVADLIAKHKPLKLVIRINLLPLVIFSYLMVHFGPIIGTVIPVFISLLPIFIISFWRKKIRKR